jgi:hypothetical protein
MKDSECAEAIIAISQAASSDPSIPPKCAASLVTLLYHVQIPSTIFSLYISFFAQTIFRLVRTPLRCLIA